MVGLLISSSSSSSSSLRDNCRHCWWRGYRPLNTWGPCYDRDRKSRQLKPNLKLLYSCFIVTIHKLIVYGFWDAVFEIHDLHLTFRVQHQTNHVKGIPFMCNSKHELILHSFHIQIQPSRLPRGGGAYTWQGCFRRRPPPPNRGKIPPLRTRGIIDPLTWGVHRGLVVGVFHCRLTGRQFESALYWSTLTSPPSGQWLGIYVQACLGIYRSWATYRRVGHCVPVVGFLLDRTDYVILLYVLALKMVLDADRA